MQIFCLRRWAKGLWLLKKLLLWWEKCMIIETKQHKFPPKSSPFVNLLGLISPPLRITHMVMECVFEFFHKDVGVCPSMEEAGVWPTLICTVIWGTTARLSNLSGLIGLFSYPWSQRYTELQQPLQLPSGLVVSKLCTVTFGSVVCREGGLARFVFSFSVLCNNG